MVGCGPYKAAVALMAYASLYYFAALVDAGMWCGGTVLTLAPEIIRCINVVNEKLLNKGRFNKCPQQKTGGALQVLSEAS